MSRSQGLLKHAQGRLTSFREDNPLSVAEDFHYDNADNRLDRRFLRFATAEPQYDSAVTDNRVKKQGRLSFEYDDQGNTVIRRDGAQVQAFEYDDENRLIRAWGQGPKGEHESRYTYDALGRRQSKRVRMQQGSTWQPEEKTTFVWQGMRLAQEKTAARTHTYVYDPNEAWTPLARVTQRNTEQKVEWFHTDINGAPLELTDEKGELSWSGKYGAWGRVNRQNARDIRENAWKPFDQSLRYAGQYSDSETGLYYNTYRYYDPGCGRFTTQDPIGLLGGLNLYQYAVNPVSYVDPLGLMCDSAKKPSSPGSMQRQVERGQAPRDVARVDRGHIPGQESHVHYADGTSSSQSGGIHDAHKGIPDPSKKAIEWLIKHGWIPPK